jgi:alpha-glucosidase
MTTDPKGFSIPLGSVIEINIKEFFMFEFKWWQTAVFYQIYPRSFADGNGDGIGDLKGIIEKLDYLRSLGIDAIWLSPQFPSPQFDCGYDVADYTDVEPDYGTLADFKHFLDEAHRRDLRVILDLVLNHTSDQHAWFQESQSSRDNPKREWYIWRDGKNGGPPNNWSAAFDDCAWTYDKVTDQWYYHFFFAEQPDLNWRNPEVKKAMWDAVRFWLDMGVDGFRLDAIGTIYEDPNLPDHEAEITMVEMFQRYMASYPQQPTSAQNAYLAEQRELMNKYQINQPGIHELLQELRSLIDEYPGDRVLVGEVDEIEYYGDGTNELHMVFNFPLMRTEKLTPNWIRKNQEERLSSLPPAAWPCNTLGNHDCNRLASTFGITDSLARVSLALILTLKGTPFLYNGEEIGMTDLMLEDIDQFRDNLGIWLYHEATQIFGTPAEDALKIVRNITRDKCRTPMQWENVPNAGFSPTGVQTWLPVNPNYAAGINEAEQENDPTSLLNFYKQLLRVRKNTPTLIAGDYQPLHEDADTYFAFLRSTSEQSCLVVLNYSDQLQRISFDLDSTTGRLLFSSTGRNGVVELTNLEVAPFEILIVE